MRASRTGFAGLLLRGGARAALGLRGLLRRALRGVRRRDLRLDLRARRLLGGAEALRLRLRERRGPGA